MSEDKHEVGAEHFEVFVGSCLETLARWGVNDWEVRFSHEQVDGVLARTSLLVVKRVAIVKLSKTWDEPVTNGRLKEVARHECVHILIGRLACLVGAGWLARDEAEAAEESLVQSLLRLLP